MVKRPGGVVKLHEGSLPGAVDDRPGRAVEVERPDGVLDPDPVDARQLLVALDDCRRDGSEVLIEDAGGYGADQEPNLRGVVNPLKPWRLRLLWFCCFRFLPVVAASRPGRLWPARYGCPAGAAEAPGSRAAAGRRAAIAAATLEAGGARARTISGHHRQERETTGKTVGRRSRPPFMVLGSRRFLLMLEVGELPCQRRGHVQRRVASLLWGSLIFWALVFNIVAGQRLIGWH